MYRDTILIHELTPPDGGEPEPEEPTCPKCLEILEECQCAYYDKLEAAELANPSDVLKYMGQQVELSMAKDAMSRLHPVSMEIKRMKVKI